MKTTVSRSDFVNGFTGGYEDNFSYDAKVALFYWFEQLEEDIGKEIEFDPVGICCEYSEYGDMEDFRAAYGEEYETLDDVENETIVIRIDGTDGFIIQDF